MGCAFHVPVSKDTQMVHFVANADRTSALQTLFLLVTGEGTEVTGACLLPGITPSVSDGGGVQNSFV